MYECVYEQSKNVENHLVMVKLLIFIFTFLLMTVFTAVFKELCV